MDASCYLQKSIHVFNLIHKYVSRILGTYQNDCRLFYFLFLLISERIRRNIPMENDAPVISRSTSQMLE